jgi:hypothetical protein
MEDEDREIFEDLSFVQNYHRMLNRAKWSALDAARILLGLIILIFAAGLQKIIVLACDDTIERRRGKKIKQLGCYRRPGQIESSNSRFRKSTELNVI